MFTLPFTNGTGVRFPYRLRTQFLSQSGTSGVYKQFHDVDVALEDLSLWLLEQEVVDVVQLLY